MLASQCSILKTEFASQCSILKTEFASQCSILKTEFKTQFSNLNMKYIVLILALMMVAPAMQAQGVAIGTGNPQPDSSAMLDIQSSTKGVLIPRLTTVSRPASPANGLLIYNADSSHFEYWNGSAWTRLTTGAGSGFSLPFGGSSNANSPLFRVQNTMTSGIANGIVGAIATGIFFYIAGSGVSGYTIAPGGYGVAGIADSGSGILGVSRATSGTPAGVFGSSAIGYGVRGEATSSTGTHYGVFGRSNSAQGYGVWGESSNGGTALGGLTNGTNPALRASNTSTGNAVRAFSDSGFSLNAFSANSSTGIISQTNRPLGISVLGVHATNGFGVFGQSEQGDGVYALSERGTALVARSEGVAPTFRVESDSGVGIQIISSNADGILVNASGDGIDADVDGLFGVRGLSSRTTGVGVLGTSNTTGNGVRAFSDSGRALFAITNVSGSPATRYAGYFQGRVEVTGTLAKGGGSFKIDHPLDPENKYLYHSFVESPDMKNIYDGVATLNASGEAEVQLDNWFESLNNSYRYQLTAMGEPAPNLHIKVKLQNNRFTIAGGKPNQEVSWQVTGIRHDAFANKNRIPVEEWKSAAERGKYLHSDAFNQPLSRDVNFTAYEEQRAMEQQQESRKARRQSERLSTAATNAAIDDLVKREAAKANAEITTSEQIDALRTTKPLQSPSPKPVVLPRLETAGEK
jgi:hypothetical protein